MSQKQKKNTTGKASLSAAPTPLKGSHSVEVLFGSTRHRQDLQAGKSTTMHVTADGQTQLRFKDIEDADFYHGHLPCEDADTLLRNKGGLVDDDVRDADGWTQLRFKDIEDADFYHGHLPREDADTLLRNEGGLVDDDVRDADGWTQLRFKDIEDADFYHGHLPREDADTLLRNEDLQAGWSTTMRVTADGRTQLRFKDIEDADFYHGHLPRKDADTLLRNEGDFLVRTTTQKVDDADVKVQALSVMWQGEGKHLIPETSPHGGVFIETFEFVDMGSLVKHYFNKRLPLFKKTPIMMLNRVPKPEWQLRKDQVTLDKKLGEGAFGEVYQGLLRPVKTKGQAPPIPLKVAVKVTHAGAMNKTQLADFMAEARLMRTYAHRNVVQLLGVVVESEPIMIVMELVPGGSLDKLLARLGDAVELPARLGYLLDAAAGLEYLHAQKCIHRDVAARNCLIGFGVVKIADFGLCRQQEAVVYKMHKRDKVPIRWLAPETLTAATYSFKSDVFSYGVLVWEVFSNGHEPYPKMTNKEVMRAVKSGYCMPHPVDMPAIVAGLLDRCWKQQPDKRPSFADIVKAMDKIISGSKTKTKHMSR